jgi:hypothetical protein
MEFVLIIILSIPQGMTFGGSGSTGAGLTSVTETFKNLETCNKALSDIRKTFSYNHESKVKIEYASCVKK